MSVTRQSFIDLADNIFDQFKDFLAPAVFTRVLDTDRFTGVQQKQTQTVSGIETGFREKVFGNRLVKVGDYMQIYKVKDFNWMPTPETDTVTRNGVESSIVDYKIDAAGATIYLHLRRL